MKSMMVSKYSLNSKCNLYDQLHLQQYVFYYYKYSGLHVYQKILKTQIRLYFPQQVLQVYKVKGQTDYIAYIGYYIHLYDHR